jgi:hypothetical protein
MKKTLLLAGLLLTVMATVSSAAGISVNWGNACWGDVPKADLTFACNSNTYTGVRMTCSFKPAETKTTFVASDLYMEGMTEEAVVPDWWKLGPTETGDCRSNLVTLSSDGSVLAGPDCLDLWQGLGGGGIGLYSWDTNRMHINAVWAVADPVEAVAETEIFAAQFRVSTGKTVGATACTGCTFGACWALNYVQVGYYLELVPTILDQPYVGGNQLLTWQSSTLNCNAVPSRNTTWGQIKSLYR